MPIEVSMKLSQKQAGKLYMKALRLEDENKKLKALLTEASEYLDTNAMTNIGHGSVLHQKFKSAVPK